jgi:hypothetical protein
VINPTSDDPNPLDAIDLSTCKSTSGTSTASTPVKYEVAPHYHSPYTGQTGVSLERQLGSGTSLTLTYLHSQGVHQVVTRNANQATGGTPQNSSGGYLYEYYPEAVFKQNQVITSVNSKLSKNLNLVGFYTLQWANTNGAGGSASNGYNLDEDYGRASFASRNSIFAMANYQGPWGIRFNPFLIAQAGRPFNITLASDPLNNFYNQRPGVATSADCASSTGRYVTTTFGCLDTTPALSPSESLIPVNHGKGPAAVALNLRISRAVGFGPKLASTNADNGGGPPPGGPPPGGGRGGPGGGPGGPGGGRGGPGGMFGPTSTGHKYSLNFSVQALNLLNDIDYGTPTGTISSTPDKSTGKYGDVGTYNPGSQFDKSTNLAGGIFSTGSAARRIFAQAIFSF